MTAPTRRPTRAQLLAAIEADARSLHDTHPDIADLVARLAAVVRVINRDTSPED